MFDEASREGGKKSYIQRKYDEEIDGITIGVPKQAYINELDQVMYTNSPKVANSQKAKDQRFANGIHNNTSKFENQRYSEGLFNEEMISSVNMMRFS